MKSILTSFPSHQKNDIQCKVKLIQIVKGTDITAQNHSKNACHRATQLN